VPEGPGDRMTVDLMNHIPLSSAYLCQDCDAVGNSAMRCPACASGVLLGLAGVLDREVEVVGATMIEFPLMAA
jgi:hypothetical protein